MRVLLRPCRGGRGPPPEGGRHLRGDRRPGRPRVGARAPRVDPLPAGPHQRGRSHGRGRARGRPRRLGQVGDRHDARPGRLRAAVDRAHQRRGGAAPGGAGAVPRDRRRLRRQPGLRHPRPGARAVRAGRGGPRRHRVGGGQPRHGRHRARPPARGDGRAGGVRPGRGRRPQRAAGRADAARRAR